MVEGLQPSPAKRGEGEEIRKKSIDRPSTISEVWFQSLIRKTGYPTSLTYPNHLFLVSCWF
jgi:hypothetical protein